MNDIINLLKTKRFDLQSEKILQSQIEQIFIDNKVDYMREVFLSKGDIIDFISGSIGIEVKISGSPTNIFRQLERYCKHDAILSIILITNKSLHLPLLINNKPTQVVNLGMAWL